MGSRGKSRPCARSSPDRRTATPGPGRPTLGTPRHRNGGSADATSTTKRPPGRLALGMERKQRRRVGLTSTRSSSGTSGWRWTRTDGPITQESPSSGKNLLAVGGRRYSAHSTPIIDAECAHEPRAGCRERALRDDGSGDREQTPPSRRLRPEAPPLVTRGSGDGHPGALVHSVAPRPLRAGDGD